MDAVFPKKEVRAITLASGRIYKEIMGFSWSYGFLKRVKRVCLAIIKGWHNQWEENAQSKVVRREEKRISESDQITRKSD